MNLIDSITPWATKIVGALLILFVGFILGRLLGIALKRLLKGMKVDKNIKKAIGYRISVERTTAGILSILIYATTIIITLNYLGLTTAVLTVIISIIIILLGFSLLLAVKDLLPNLFAGITLKFQKEFEEGDRIEIRNVLGKVKDITLLSTSVEAAEDTLVIPNSLFMKEGFKIRKPTKKTRKKEK